MKQTILTCIIALAIPWVSIAKNKVIVNPAYEFSNSGIEHITKIESGKNETRLHIHITFLPNWWVHFSQATYIEDCATGKRLHATGVVGGEFDKRIFMSKTGTGDSTFVLIFPPLDKSVTKINYGSFDPEDEDDKDVATIFGISLKKKAKPAKKGIPAKVSKWINGELAKAKRKTLMDFESGEFFSPDTARLIGYIKGYDTRSGFSTGMIYVANDITNEDYPVVIQIHEDGRFEGVIPMNYPKYMSVYFKESNVGFYIQPGQTLAMLLEWDDFLTADRLRNITYIFKNTRYQGAAADINNELSAFYAQLPHLSSRKFYDGIKDKNPDEFKSFLNKYLSDYTRVHQQLLETEKLSEQSKVILQNNYQIMYAGRLFEYEMRHRIQSNYQPQLPLEFFDFLQDIPLDNKELLSAEGFGTFINRLEFSPPFFHGVMKKLLKKISPEKTNIQYLFEELNIQKTPEDEAFLLMLDSINIKLSRPDIPLEKREKLAEEFNNALQKFNERYEQQNEAYQKKYVDVIKKLTLGERALEEWRIRDSIYINELKLNQGIVYDVTKIRSLSSTFRSVLKNNTEDAWNFLFALTDMSNFLTALTADIPEPFLKKEAERLFTKYFPTEPRAAYELPDTHEAKIFKEVIAPFKGKIILVDFWATTCGPCVYTIKQHKELREKYQDSPDIAFIFITSEEESPLKAYEKFVTEQELTHTFRLNADPYRYLRQLFRFNGIPRYVLVDREGKILDDNYDVRSPGFETRLKELLND